EPAASPPPPPAMFHDISDQAGLAVAMTEKVVDEFADQPLLPARQHALGPSLAVGDLDADGMDDVIVGGVAGQPRRLLRQVGTKHVFLDDPVAAGAGEVPDAGVLVLEADGDGRPDLFIVKG